MEIGRLKTKLNDLTSVQPAYRTTLNAHFVEIRAHR